MKKDIENMDDILLFFHVFYGYLLKDELFIPFFKRMQENNIMEEHIQVMANFWDNILFYSGKYEGNPMEKHSVINIMNRLEPTHFTKWLHYFNASMDELYSGEKASLAKDRAVSIAVVMEKKMLEQRRYRME